MPAYNRRYLVVLIILLMLVSTINVADKELLAPVADAVRLDLDMNDTQLGAVRSAVFLAALFGQIFWGPLSDRWVRKNIITIGTIIWSGLTWMTAYVVNFPQLLAALASMSFAEGCFNPSAYALLTDTFPKRRHGLVLGLMSLTYPVGTAMALVIAGLIGTHRWRQPFILFGLIGILLGVLVFWLVREPARGATEEAVEAAEGSYAGRFSFKEFRKVLAIPTVLLGFALDTCQAAVNWSFAFWAPSYLTRYQIAPDAESAALALLPAILGFVIGALVGVTAGGLSGAKDSLTLENATKAVQAMCQAAKEVNPDVIVFTHGGPFKDPETAEYSILHSEAVGYAAGSSGERLPTENAIIEVTTSYKNMKLDVGSK